MKQQQTKSGTWAKPWFQRCIGAMAIAMLPLSIGCQDQLKYENYSRIRAHQSDQQQVVELLGEPCAKYGNQWMYERPKRDLCALIDFTEDGQVIRKQWVDSKNLVWEDSDEAGGGWLEAEMANE